MIDRPALDLRWELERNERRLGMCSLDTRQIAYHFGRARRLRELGEQAAGRTRMRGPTGTKGSCAQPSF